MEKRAGRGMGDFNPQTLANTARALATAGQPDVVLFTALAREVEQRVGDFHPQHLANTAWASATVVGVCDGRPARSGPQLFAALARVAEQRYSKGGS